MALKRDNNLRGYTVKQGTDLIAKANFTARLPGAKRGISVKPGDKFWVTTPSYSNTDFVGVARKGITTSYLFTAKDVQTLFEAV
ncbi:hypothetical protein vBPaerPsIn_110 [Pseudomonas phage vB_Paer_PsIn]|uniref:Uncharacterized protein n=1 Tax=Pseudomonas phage vB_Paer_PsIn TaxID=2924907 RepID=A0AAE9KEH3_9CAUD|nr:hypothetical protein QE348_gp110 [Pseudomonas phage vB_Paer_PsIn]UOL48138.1 hypothetical protein vBPaerPsIn_110 [Pseudomonas phage vB_Paer_PsIn]